MEFKMFGPGGYPDAHFHKGLKALFVLDETAWELLAKWFETTGEFDSEEGSCSPLIAGSSLVPEQFVESADVLKYVLEAWQMYGLTIPEIQRDVLVLNYPPEQIDRLGRLLERLGPVKERVYTEYMRFDHENAVLPTLEDIRAVCDLRPVFQDTVYPIPEAATVSHTKLLGYSYMALVEMVAEDFEGRKHRFAFQVNARTLANFRAALERAEEQLDILKASTSALSTEKT